MSQCFVKRGEKVHGPFSEERLRAGLRSGKLTDLDLISESQEGPWCTLADWLNQQNENTNPNLISCPDCDGKVSKRASACPHCGSPLSEPKIAPEMLVTGSVPLSPQQQWTVPSGQPTQVTPQDHRKVIHPSTPPKDPVLMGLLSGCLLLGLGQILLGQTTKGICILLGGLLLAVLTAGISVIIVFPAAGFDAYLIAKKLKEGKAVGEWEWF
jgi:TM2 domain-containing membrane protein YozV